MANEMGDFSGKSGTASTATTTTPATTPATTTPATTPATTTPATTTPAQAGHDKVHPVGSGVGAAAGAATGAAVGTAVAGPVGTLVGAAVGALAGGLVGHGVAEGINPTVEDAYWRENYRSRPYADANRGYDEYQAAYKYGWESRGQYAGKRFEDVEPDLERGWDTARGTSRQPWNEARNATRDAWHRVEVHPDTK